MDAVRITKEQLFGSASAGTTVALRVNSDSMRPFLKEDDIVTLSPAPGYRRGDIVLARDLKGQIVLHQLLHTGQDTVTVAGTANLFRRETCRPDMIAARAIEVTRGDRRFSPYSPLRRLALLLWPSSPILRRILLRLFR